MTEKEFLSAFGEISETYIEAAAATAGGAGKAPSRRIKGRFSLVLIAAAVCLLLMGAAAAVGAIYGEDIQSWFSHQWELVTRRNMSEGQLAVIDHLSQDIGQSAAVDGVTVTVDSATVGDGSFYLLLRAEGVKFSSRYNYGFGDILMELSPDPRDEGETFGGYGFQYQGLDGDGAALFLISFNYAGWGDAGGDTSPLRVTLTLRDLTRSPERRNVLAGEWALSFSIDRSHPPQAAALPDTPVTLEDHRTHAGVTVWLRDIRVTNTGIRFRLDDAFGSLAPFDGLRLILKSGAEVGNDGGYGVPLDGAFLEWSYMWQFPVDLDEAAYVCIGGKRLPLPSGEQQGQKP